MVASNEGTSGADLPTRALAVTEFGILTDAHVAEAAQACTRLRTSLAAEGLPVSFGWAAAPEDGVGSLELFRKADDRLYAAKLIARNHRVVEQLAAARH